MLNWRLLSAWPNYLIVPTMLLFWVVFGLLIAQLIGAVPNQKAQ